MTMIKHRYVYGRRRLWFMWR